MNKTKLTATHFTLIGIAIGILIVIGMALALKGSLKPENVEPVHVQPSNAMQEGQTQQTCPVCKKLVNPANDYSETIAGKTFHFCGDICHRSFLQEPFRYLKDMKVNIDVQIVPVDGETPQPQEIQPTEPAATEEIPLPDEPPADEELSRQEPPYTPPAQEQPIQHQAPPQIQEVPVDIPMPEEIPLDGSGAQSSPPAQQPQQQAAPPPQNRPTAKPQELQIEEIPLE